MGVDKFGNHIWYQRMLLSKMLRYLKMEKIKGSLWSPTTHHPFSFTNMNKTESPRMASYVRYKLLLKCDEPFLIFSGAWTSTNDENTKEKQLKTKRRKNGFSAPRSQKNVTSKNDVKCLLGTLYHKRWKFFLMSK